MARWEVSTAQICYARGGRTGGRLVSMPRDSEVGIRACTVHLISRCPLYISAGVLECFRAPCSPGCPVGSVVLMKVSFSLCQSVQKWKLLCSCILRIKRFSQGCFTTFSRRQRSSANSVLSGSSRALKYFVLMLCWCIRSLRNPGFRLAGGTKTKYESRPLVLTGAAVGWVLEQEAVSRQPAAGGRRDYWLPPADPWILFFQARHGKLKVWGVYGHSMLSSFFRWLRAEAVTRCVDSEGDMLALWVSSVPCGLEENSLVN